MKVQIYGTGCARCALLENVAKQAIKDMGINAEVVKVNDFNQIIEAGILAMPGFAVEGEVKSMGKVSSPNEIKKWINAKCKVRT